MLKLFEKRNNRANIVLNILFFLVVGLSITVYVILYHVLDFYVTPFGIASGATTDTAYVYMTAFWKFFPLIMFLGTLLYVFINAQKPEQGVQY